MNFHQGFFYTVKHGVFMALKCFTGKAFSITHILFFFRSYLGNQIYASLY